MKAEPPNDLMIFTPRLESGAPGARAAYLDRACRADTVLRSKIDSLLAAYEKASDTLDDPEKIPATFASARLQELECPGTQIGRHKFLQKIGEGGMGVVYMAEQEEPVRRKVALKVIKLGMDTKQVVARFEAERQTLALMDHPNIAKVFDAGATGAESQISNLRSRRAVRTS